MISDRRMAFFIALAGELPSSSFHQYGYRTIHSTLLIRVKVWSHIHPSPERRSHSSTQVGRQAEFSPSGACPTRSPLRCCHRICHRQSETSPGSWFEVHLNMNMLWNVDYLIHTSHTLVHTPDWVPSWTHDRCWSRLFPAHWVARNSWVGRRIVPSGLCYSWGWFSSQSSRDWRSFLCCHASVWTCQLSLWLIK